MLLSASPLVRQAGAEFVGTGLLVAAIVGAGISAQELFPDDAGLQLMQCALATAFVITALIWAFGPMSGAHLNPAVTIAARVLGSRLRATRLTAYLIAQVAGAIGGCLLAGAMFGQPPSISSTARALPGSILAEVVATAGLVVVIVALTRTRRTVLIAPAVGAYIGAAYWFTSSTGFANPAVTIGRMFTDTFAGIAPTSAIWFVAAQLVGGAIAVMLMSARYPSHARSSECPTPSRQ